MSMSNMSRDGMGNFVSHRESISSSSQAKAQAIREILKDRHAGHRHSHEGGGARFLPCRFVGGGGGVSYQQCLHTHDLHSLSSKTHSPSPHNHPPFPNNKQTDLPDLHVSLVSRRASAVSGAGSDGGGAGGAGKWFSPASDLHGSWDMLKSSWLNVLILAAPLGLASEALGWPPTATFTLVRSVTI
jgi:hypothetical protein